MDKMFYYKISQYKYELAADFKIQINIFPDKDIVHKYFTLLKDGSLAIKAGYKCDGPSGPTIDTPDFMIGSFVHDVLYQCMRLGFLDYKVYRLLADKELYRICRLCGMPWWRASYVYNAVRWFAEECAKPKEDDSEKLFTAPT